MITAAAPTHELGNFQRFEIDWTLLVITLVLASFGLLMVGSASMSVSEYLYNSPWTIVKNHGMYLLLGLGASLVLFQVPMSLWQQYSWVLLAISVLLLLVVLVPGVGKRVNGSQRWLAWPVSIQVSEIAKFFLVIFFADYLSRFHIALKTSWRGFLPPFAIVCLVALLLLLEPDFGNTLVIACTVFAMMFIAGAKLLQFSGLALMGAMAMALIAIVTPYRMQRLVTFLDPWQDNFGSGYQLTQSLVAFGHGNWFGVGFGNSLQKLFYLPDAHTDFIFAIIAEEFGLVGALIVLALFALLVLRIFKLSRRAILHRNYFIALAAFGIAFLIAMQALVNMGVASGALPTKGLTLPFISYGGSSVIINCLLISFTLRMHWELLGQPTAVQPSSIKSSAAKSFSTKQRVQHGR